MALRERVLEARHIHRWLTGAGQQQAGSQQTPLLERKQDGQASTCRSGCACFAANFLQSTTDTAFIRSEVNGRQSRRIVLAAFFAADIIGAVLWAAWCQNGQATGSASLLDAGEDPDEQARACNSFGLNHFVLLALTLPVEGMMLFQAGRNPWSFWSDALLLPVWLIRLVLFDVLLWNVPPQTLIADALWFSVMAVMCRVHSLALVILVASQITSLYFVLTLRGALTPDAFARMRYGAYSVAMLCSMAGAYLLDEQSRLQSFLQVMSLEDQNAALAESLIRWKVIPESPSSRPLEFEFHSNPRDRPLSSISGGSGAGPAWRHTVLEETEPSSASSSSFQATVPVGEGFPGPLPLPQQSSQRVRFNLQPTRLSFDKPREHLTVPTRPPKIVRASNRLGQQMPVSLRDAME